jgi:hypothetical protein
VSTLVQAMLHGLAMQSAADPDAVNSEEIIELCLDMLHSYLWPSSPPKKAAGRRPAARSRSTNSNGTKHHERNHA